MEHQKRIHSRLEVQAGRWVGTPRTIYEALKSAKERGRNLFGRVAFIGNRCFIHNKRNQVVVIERDNSFKITINQSWYE